MVTQQRTKRTRHSVRAMAPEEKEWVERARAGESLRDHIILSLQGRIERMASRFMQRPSLQTYAFEQGDLVQSANEAMLRCYALALSKENPIAYLLGAARLEMVSYLNGRYGTIKSEPQYQDPIPMLSLDKLLHPYEGEGQTLADVLAIEVHLQTPLEESHYALLLQAVEALPQKQRDIIKRHYGLEEFAPESLMSIARELSPNTASRPHSAQYHHKQAIGKLQTLLQQCCFSLCTGGMS